MPLPPQSQSKQLQNLPITTSPKASISQQPQIENDPKDPRRILLFLIHRTKQQQQQQQKDLTTASPEAVSRMNHCHMVRHRHLRTAPVIYHQKAINKTHTMGTAKYMYFPNSNHPQLSMNGSRSSLERRILSHTNIQYHRFSHESQSDRRLVKFSEAPNIKQRQPPLQELAVLYLSLPQTRTAASTVSNKQPLSTSTFKRSSSPPLSSLHIPERLSRRQLRAQRRKPKASHLSISVIPTAEPNDSALQFAPQRLSHSGILARAFPEPVLASQTTAPHISLKRQDQSSTLTENIRAHLPSDNDAFLECCKRKNIDVRCELRCNFDVLDRKVLTAMFIGSDPCPRSNGRNLLSCAAQDLDHTNCCRANGVHQTAAGGKCLRFCQMTPEANFQADISMLPCWGVLKEIKQCFRLSLIEKRNIKNAA